MIRWLRRRLLRRHINHLCEQVVELQEAVDRIRNDHGALTAQIALHGRITGLYIALCLAMGWDPSEESDKEGRADDYVRGWRQARPVTQEELDEITERSWRRAFKDAAGGEGC